MKKTKLVIFTSNNARILVGANPKEYPTAWVNPDLSRVKGTPPHFWKIVGNQIHPMNFQEMAARLDHHARHGVDNDISGARAEVISKARRWDVLKSKAAWAAASAGFPRHHPPRSSPRE